MLTREVQPFVERVQQFLKVRKSTVELGIHGRNDSYTAVAISRRALSLGVKQVQGAMNGYG